MMIKKSLAALATAWVSVSTLCAAESYVHIGNTDDSTFYQDVNSIQKLDQGRILVQDKQVFLRSPQFVITLWEYDCFARRQYAREVKTYANKQATPEVTQGDKWYDVKPGDVDSYMYDSACSRVFPPTPTSTNPATTQESTPQALTNQPAPDTTPVTSEEKTQPINQSPVPAPSTPQSEAQHPQELAPKGPSPSNPTMPKSIDTLVFILGGLIAAIVICSSFAFWMGKKRGSMSADVKSRWASPIVISIIATISLGAIAVVGYSALEQESGTTAHQPPEDVTVANANSEQKSTPSIASQSSQPPMPDPAPSPVMPDKTEVCRVGADFTYKRLMGWISAGMENVLAAHNQGLLNRTALAQNASTLLREVQQYSEQYQWSDAVFVIVALEMLKVDISLEFYHQLYKSVDKGSYVASAGSKCLNELTYDYAQYGFDKPPVPGSNSAVNFATLARKMREDMTSSSQPESARPAAQAPRTVQYNAVLSCTTAGSRGAIALCFEDTVLKVRTNTGVKAYTAINIYQAGQNFGGELVIPLQPPFELQAQNGRRNFVLTLKLYDGAKNLVFEDQAAGLGDMIHVKRD